MNNAMNFIKLFIFLIILLYISCASAQAALQYDVNGNGTIDIVDLVIIQQHFNEITSSPYQPYDVNSDGVVNISDATLVGQHIGETVSGNISSTSNLLANPGFEIGTTSPLNWSFVTNNGSTPVWDANVSHSGARSVKIQIPGTQDNISGYPKSDLIPLLPNTTYNFSAWGMTEGAGGTYAPAVRIVEVDANFNFLRQTNIEFSKGSNAWVQKSIIINTTSNTSFAYVYANIWNGYGTFRVDDVEVRGVAEVTTIAILFSTAYLVAYQTQQFTAIGYDAKGNTIDINPKWSSSNTTVGTIDLLGLFTALNPGTTNITATSGAANANAMITVTSTGYYYIINSNGTVKVLNGTTGIVDYSGPTAVQNAINSLPFGGIVHFDTGIFKTNIKILYNNIILEGSGQNTTLELDDGNERVILSNNTNNITIRNFTINGRNDIAIRSTTRFNNVTNLKIENNYFVNSKIRAIDVYPYLKNGVNFNKYIYIFNNRFTNNTLDAIYVSANNVTIQGNIIDDSPDTAIDTGDLISNVIITNNIINKGNAGILLSNYYGNGTVSNNILKNITGNGISVSAGNSSNHSIKNNIINSSSSGYSAITLSNTTNIQIINNSLDGFSAHQIRCKDAKNIYISRNIYLNQRYNYGLFSTCTNLIVEYNIFYLNQGQAGIYSNNPIIAINNIFSIPDGSIKLDTNSNNSLIINNLHFNSRTGFILNNSGFNYILNNRFINSVYNQDLIEQSGAGSNIFKNNSYEKNIINLTIGNFTNITFGNNSVISQNYSIQPFYWGIRTTQPDTIGNGEIYFNSSSVSLCYLNTLTNKWMYYDNNSAGC